MKKIALSFLSLSFFFNLHAQNIGINTTGSAASTLNMLEVLQISTTANSVGIYSNHSGNITGTGYGLKAITGGTSTTNVAGYFSATGATNNYAGIFEDGNVGIGTTAPTSHLQISTTSADPATGTQYLGIRNDITVTGSAPAAIRTLIGDYNTITNSVDDITFHRLWGSYNFVNTTGANTFQIAYAQRNLSQHNSTGTATTSMGTNSESNNVNTGTITNSYGVQGAVANTSSGTIGNARGVYAIFNNTGTGTITSGYGLYSLAQNNNVAGTTNNGYGVYTLLRANQGTIANGRGFYATINAPAAGTFTNAYGLFVEFTGAGTFGSKWGTYISGETQNYFSGNVGIGTTGPAYKLDVNGAIAAGNSDIYFTNTTHSHTGIGNTAGYAALENASNYNTLMILGRAGGIGGARSVSLWDRLDVNGGLNVTGNVGVGLIASGSYKVEVNGRLKTTGINETSDIRLKKNILTIDNALSKVQQLRGVSYEWRADEFKDKGLDTAHQIGLIAQEVEKIFPQLVGTDNTGFKSVEYSKVVAVLIEAIKEQQKIINNQKAEITSLNGNVNDMQKDIASLKTSFEILLKQNRSVAGK